MERPFICYLLFAVMLMLISPLLHEAAHIVILETLNCWYQPVFKGNVFEINFLCDRELSDTEIILIFISGMSAQILFSGLLICSSVLFRRSKRIKKMHIYLNSANLGNLTSLFLYITSRENDVTELLSHFNVKIPYVFISISSTIIAILLVIIFIKSTYETAVKGRKSKKPKR